jgi:5-methylcytosine-specific restriction endonuclease McrA
MRYTDDDLRWIYDRTSGKCHLCHKMLAYTNYGRFGARGAWEVEHSNARARGGTDSLVNLYAAHISCNRSKGTATTRAARGWHGRSKAPLSRERRRQVRTSNTVGAAAVGVVTGAAVAGAPGAVIGGLAGLVFGSEIDPDS